MSVLKDLMDAMFQRRREWIGMAYPSAAEVLDIYPCLLSVKIVRKCVIGFFIILPFLFYRSGMSLEKFLVYVTAAAHSSTHGTIS